MHPADMTDIVLDLPFIDLDIPFQELELDDVPSLDEVMKTSQPMLSPPLTINQTTYTDRICIRINNGVLAALKKKAAAYGMRYQTYINVLLAQHA